MQNLRIGDIHCHAHSSNFRLPDCIIKENLLIDRAIEMNRVGVCLTDHETVSGHIRMIKYVKKLKKQGIIDDNFKIGLGNEIYLVDSLEEVKDNYQSGITKFYHFLLIAKNLKGHEQLREISSSAWDNSFRTGFMERVPTIKEKMKSIIGESKGNLIASTACLGGELPNLVLKLVELENIKSVESENTLIDKEIYNVKLKIHEFLNWCIDLFGKDNFFIELQPSPMLEQITFNKRVLEIAKAYKLKTVISNDIHYLKKEHRPIHEAHLNSKDGEREVADFYITTYMMEIEEMWEYLQECMSEEEFIESVNNTVGVFDLIEVYDLEHEVIIPDINVCDDFEIQHLFKEYYNSCEYLKLFANSPHLQDQYFLFQIEQGFIKKKQVVNKENIERIDIELKELWLISQALEQRMSSYYNLTKKIVDIMWEDSLGNSLVGVSRGSVTGFYTAYLIDIHQMNPIEWGLPHWRHISAERIDFPD